MRCVLCITKARVWHAFKVLVGTMGTLRAGTQVCLVHFRRERASIKKGSGGGDRSLQE